MTRQNNAQKNNRRAKRGLKRKETFFAGSNDQALQTSVSIDIESILRGLE